MLVEKLYKGNSVLMGASNEYGKYRARAEVGVIGYGLLLLLQFGSIICLINGAFTATSLKKRYVLILIVLYLLLNIFNTMVSNYIFNIGFWFVLGLGLTLIDLPKASPKS